MSLTAGAVSVCLKEFPEEETDFIPESALMAKVTAIFGQVGFTLVLIADTVMVVVGMIRCLCSGNGYYICFAASVRTVVIITSGCLGSVTVTSCIVV